MQAKDRTRTPDPALQIASTNQRILVASQTAQLGC
jgi:hypothetical protein